MKTEKKLRVQGGADIGDVKRKSVSNVGQTQSQVKNSKPTLSAEQMFSNMQVMLMGYLRMGRVPGLNIKAQPQGADLVEQMKLTSYDCRTGEMTIKLPRGKTKIHPNLLIELEAIADSQNYPVKRVSAVASIEPVESFGLSGGILIERPHRMAMRNTDWLWHHYIPLGRITIMAGDPGIGKSQTAIDLLARITRGNNMPDGTPGTLGNCAIATAEDETAETIMPRLAGAGANMHKVRVIRKVSTEMGERYLKLPSDLELLRATIREEKLKLLIIDPLNAFVEQGVDTHKDQDIRSVLAPVEGLAEEMQCSILIIAHLNKREEAAALYRVGGSIGFVAAARSVLAVQMRKQNDTDEMRVLYSLKSNLSRKPPAQQYAIQSCTVTEKSTGEAIATSKIAWQGVCADPSSAGRDEGPQKRKECLEFLVRCFERDNEVPSLDLQRAAKAAGIAWRTLAEYKHEFEIEPVKMQNGHWAWRAPADGFKQFRKAKG